MNYGDRVEQDVIRIQMFGGFRISVGDKSISDTDTRTKQLWLLLQYLIAFRSKTVSQEEIIKVMWPENDIENPANALKNLVYRIRTTFQEWEIPYARDMIIYNRGSYQWNNNLPCIVDVEEFEKHVENAQDTSLGKEYQLQEYKKVIELYKGDFLPGNSGEAWVIPMSSYLRTLFFKSVYAKLDILTQFDDELSYERVVLTCRKTLIIDPLEEAIHRYLMFALYKLGKQREALEHYHLVTDQFYKELGLGPSEELQKLYLEISHTTKPESDIGTLQQDLREHGEPEGAFYCEYEVFKNLYRIEARTAARTGKSMFICMLTITHNLSDALELPLLNEAMKVLGDTIQGSLRKGDVFSRFSPTQYVLLLPTGSYENAELVVTRIMQNYRREYRNPEINLQGKIVPLEPKA